MILPTNYMFLWAWEMKKEAKGMKLQQEMVEMKKIASLFHEKVNMIRRIMIR